MNKLGIEEINTNRINITVSDTPEGVQLTFKGDIDMQDPSTILDPLFEKVHKGANEKGFTQIQVDFKELNFLNSSGIKAVAKWIMKIADSGKKYSIKLLHNREITWQATSLPTLTFLVPGAVKVE
jgi:hypothetical protein